MTRPASNDPHNAPSTGAIARRYTRRGFLGVSAGALAVLGAAAYGGARGRTLLVVGGNARAEAMAGAARPHWNGAIGVMPMNEASAELVLQDRVVGVLFAEDRPSPALARALMQVDKPVYCPHARAAAHFTSEGCGALTTCEPGWLPAPLFDAAESLLDRAGPLQHIHADAASAELIDAAGAVGYLAGLDDIDRVTALGGGSGVILDMAARNGLRAVVHARDGAASAMWLRGARGSVCLTPETVRWKARGGEGWTLQRADAGGAPRQLRQWLAHISVEPNSRPDQSPAAAARLIGLAEAALETRGTVRADRALGEAAAG